MIVVETSPRAPDFRPLSTGCSTGSTTCSVVAMSSPLRDKPPRATVLAPITASYKGFRSDNWMSTLDFVLKRVSIHDMRILLVGAGGVGSALASIAARRRFADLIIADHNLARAQRAAAAKDGYSAVQLDARDEQAVAAVAAEYSCDVLMNATDPRFVMPLFRAALRAGLHYMDMAVSLSRPDPAEPYRRTGVKLGDEQFAAAGEWEESGKLALVGMGVEPGLSDVFARHAADALFREIDEVGVRDGANLVVDGYDFAPTFSIWTTIEECLNPPVVWERDRGWFTTEPFSEPEAFDFPCGIGSQTCVNVEHEEVLLIPRWVDVGRVTFKYGLSDEFINV